MRNMEEMIKILEDTIDKKDKIIADYKNMCDNYIKLIHDCKDVIYSKEDKIKAYEKELAFYKKYEKTDEEIQNEVEEFGYYAVEDFMSSLPKLLQLIIKPWFDKYYE